MFKFFKITLSIICFTIISNCSDNDQANNNNQVKNSQKNKKEISKKVLMIGNSFTFYWNLPQVLERMFAIKDIRIKVDQKTIGGSKLSDHWNYYQSEDYKLEHYDYIILNDYSTYAIKQIDTCAKYIKLFTSQIHKINSKPLIYGTWEYPSLKKTAKFSNSNTMKRLDSLAVLIE